MKLSEIEEHKGVIQETTHYEGEYVSTMFLLCSSALRRTALIRLPNLKSVNECVQYHFKMGTLQSANGS